MTQLNREESGANQTGMERFFSQHLRYIIFFSIGFFILFGVSSYFTRNGRITSSTLPTPIPVIAVEGTNNTDTMIQRHAQSPSPFRIGIIAGHKDSDSGATCEDGLTEASINLGIAEKAIRFLQEKGFETDLLSEYDPRLTDYEGYAVVSIHADSCTGAGATLSGYKIAGSATALSGSLQQCMQENYAAWTRLPYAETTITRDMIGYHAFNKVAATTPIIILETGFMNMDRELLTTNSDIPASAITDGIVCFVERTQ